MDGVRIFDDAGPSGTGPDTEYEVPPAPALAAANEALAQMRLSFESSSSPERSTNSPSYVNGFTYTTTAKGVNGSTDSAPSLQEELQRTKQENETLTAKYNTLVTKLSAMRTSVESKLKRDAVCISRNKCLAHLLLTRPLLGRTRPKRAACSTINSPKRRFSIHH